jgi:hypothetical protein
MKKLTIYIFLPVLIMAITMGSLILPKQSAYADAANAPQMILTRTPVAPLAKDAAKAALSNMFKREQNWLNLQSSHLQKASEIAGTTQKLIDAAKTEGKDTSALESALTQFNASISSAQTDHNQAGDIINAANGFDGSGNVTDLNSAHQTVENARLSLRSAHNSIVQATRNLAQALRDWKNSH